MIESILSLVPYIGTDGKEYVDSSLKGKVPVRRNARVFIYDIDSNREINYLLLHAPREGYWQPPQGGIDEGEDFYEAGCREAKEETGINPNTLLPLEGMVSERRYFSKRNGQDQYSISTAFPVRGDLNAKIVLNPEDGHDCYMWAEYKKANLMLVKYSETNEDLHAIHKMLLDSSIVKTTYKRDIR